MPSESTFTQRLQKYADLTVQIGVGLQAGQRLIVRAPVEAAPLVRLIAETAYKLGARLVDVLWHDDALTLTRFKYAPRDSFEEYPTWRADALNRAADRGDAVLAISGADPDLLREQNPELISLVQRVGQTHLMPYRRKAMADELNWCVIAQPTPGWAAKVFPDGTPAEQVDRLWEAIFKICRIDQSDPVAAWRHHLKELATRRDYLNDRRYTALKYTAPGTDLTVGLPEHHLWNGAETRTLAGLPFIANVPTEEVFTLPHANRVEGVVTSTKPLSYGGVLIENFSLNFEGGRAVKATADKGETVLQNFINTDAGAARLGEVALVPHSSPISQSGLLFFNTLFDENASNHLALGKGYRFCMKEGAAMSDEEFASAGGNDSLVHVDFMIGSAEMDIDGLAADGSAEAVMRGGEWAF